MKGYIPEGKPSGINWNEDKDALMFKIKTIQRPFNPNMSWPAFNSQFKLHSVGSCQSIHSRGEKDNPKIM